jgi:hypothetical protein
VLRIHTWTREERSRKISLMLRTSASTFLRSSSLSRTAFSAVWEARSVVILGGRKEASGKGDSGDASSSANQEDALDAGGRRLNADAAFSSITPDATDSFAGTAWSVTCRATSSGRSCHTNVVSCRHKYPSNWGDSVAVLSVRVSLTLMDLVLGS